MDALTQFTSEALTYVRLSSRLRVSGGEGQGTSDREGGAIVRLQHRARVCVLRITDLVSKRH